MFYSEQRKRITLYAFDSTDWILVNGILCRRAGVGEQNQLEIYGNTMFLLITSAPCRSAKLGCSPMSCSRDRWLPFGTDECWNKFCAATQSRRLSRDVNKRTPTARLAGRTDFSDAYIPRLRPAVSVFRCERAHDIISRMYVIVHPNLDLVYCTRLHNCLSGYHSTRIYGNSPRDHRNVTTYKFVWWMQNFHRKFSVSTPTPHFLENSQKSRCRLYSQCFFNFLSTHMRLAFLDNVVFPSGQLTFSSGSIMWSFWRLVIEWGTFCSSMRLSRIIKPILHDCRWE